MKSDEDDKTSSIRPEPGMDAISSISHLTGRAKSRSGAGTLHCLHAECMGMKPVTRERNHHVQHSEKRFAECTGDNCLHCANMRGKLADEFIFTRSTSAIRLTALIFVSWGAHIRITALIFVSLGAHIRITHSLCQCSRQEWPSQEGMQAMWQGAMEQ